MTKTHWLIAAVVVVIIIIVAKWYKSHNSSDNSSSTSSDPQKNPKLTNTSVNTSSSSGAGSSSTSSPVQTSDIGKTAYAKVDNTYVFNDANISTSNVYKMAKKGDWVGTIIGDTSVGSSTSRDFWVVSGSKVVAKSSVSVK